MLQIFHYGNESTVRWRWRWDTAGWERTCSHTCCCVAAVA